ncbi:hypothetical protein NPIL_267701 [Nephila pilipes]|uniref:Uncharacterized protein n=1 Tax=Nephila pilipes TaxID=299642 RepID=A0A8X6MQ33_NEPPI|nr:hypothetical protein NPIL_267701 [Nephila pilipes]
MLLSAIQPILHFLRNPPLPHSFRTLPHASSASSKFPNSISTEWSNLNHPPPDETSRISSRIMQPKGRNCHRSGRKLCSYSCVSIDNGDEIRVHRPFSRPNVIVCKQMAQSLGVSKKSCWASGLPYRNPGPSPI